MEARELEKCIDKFGTEIYRFCMKLCMNKANAEDLYQQTFLKALESDMKKVTREKKLGVLLLRLAIIWMMKARIYCIQMKM